MKKILFPILALVLVLGMTLTTITAVFAASDPYYDMTTDLDGAEEEVEINGAIWKTLPITDATGSGVFNAFFRVQNSPNERGYNTDGRPLQYDELTSATFTHSYPSADVPLVEYPEGSDDWYYEFQLDINESKNTPYMSLDEFQVWTTNDPNQLGYVEVGPPWNGSGSFTSGAQLEYDLDADGDTFIIMDYRWNTGSGKRDYRVLVPEANFADALEYVIIFTRHGNATNDVDMTTDDGFEEWGVAAYPEMPDTAVTITASENTVYAGDTVDLYVSEANTGVAPLYQVEVTVEYDSTPLVTLDDTTAVESMANDNILEVGEVWTWTISGVQVDAFTTFTATGWATTKKSGNPKPEQIITFPDNELEQDTVDVDTIDPDTLVDIDTVGSVNLIYEGDTVDLVVTEENTGDDPLDNVSVTVEYDSTLLVTLDDTTALESGTDNNILDVGETWTWNAATDTELDDVVVSVFTTFTATGTGTDSLGNPVTAPEYEDEEDTVDVDTIDPDTLVDIDTVGQVYLVYAGDTVDLVVTEENTGNDPLTNVSVTVEYDSTLLVTLDDTTAIESGTDNNILDVGETWTWNAATDTELDEVVVSVFTTFTATGYGEDSLGNPVTWDAYAGEQDTVDVDVEEEFGKRFTDPMVWDDVLEDWITLAEWHIANTLDSEGLEQWFPLNQQIKWTVIYTVPNASGEDWTNVVIRDRFGAELDLITDPQYQVGGVGTHYQLTNPNYIDGPYPIADAIMGEGNLNNDPDADDQGVGFYHSKAKQMPQLRFIWYIGDLEDSQGATLSFEVATRINHGQGKKAEPKWEFTSCGIHVLNSGVSLKYLDPSEEQQSESTDGWAIQVCMPDPPEVTTELFPAGPITLGDDVYDTAHVSGLEETYGEEVYGADGQPYPMPTGDVQFQYKDDDDTAWNNFGDPEPLDGDGEATSATIDPLLLTVGENWFRAAYEGDVNYPGNESAEDAEPLIVEAIPTTTVTELTPPGPITQGQMVTDEVTIDTTAAGTLPVVSGTWTVEASQDLITWYPVGDGNVSDPLPFVVSTAAWEPPSWGTWYFMATYSGDANYEGSQSLPADEILIVNIVNGPD